MVMVWLFILWICSLIEQDLIGIGLIIVIETLRFSTVWLNIHQINRIARILLHRRKHNWTYVLLSFRWHNLAHSLNGYPALLMTSALGFLMMVHLRIRGACIYIGKTCSLWRRFDRFISMVLSLAKLSVLIRHPFIWIYGISIYSILWRHHWGTVFRWIICPTLIMTYGSTVRNELLEFLFLGGISC